MSLFGGLNFYMGLTPYLANNAASLYVDLGQKQIVKDFQKKFGMIGLFQ